MANRGKLGAWGLGLAAMALAAGWGLAAAGTVRELTPANCRVMEQVLARRGQAVRVESGALVQANRELKAILSVKLADGRVVTYEYDFGPLTDGRDYIRRQP